MRTSSRSMRAARHPPHTQIGLRRTSGKSAEHTYSRNGRSSGRPTRRQKSARSRVGCRSNHWSKHCAPVTATRSGGTPCNGDRFLRLRVVPDEDAAGSRRDRLAREVVPAPDAHRRRNATSAPRCAADRAATTRRRRRAASRKDVGPLFVKKRLDRRAARHGVLERVERPRQAIAVTSGRKQPGPRCVHDAERRVAPAPGERARASDRTAARDSGDRRCRGRIFDARNVTWSASRPGHRPERHLVADAAARRSTMARPPAAESARSATRWT